MARPDQRISGIDLATTIHHLQALKGAYVDNIYQPTPEIFSIRVNVLREELSAEPELFGYVIEKKEETEQKEEDISFQQGQGKYVKLDITIHLGKALTLRKPWKVPDQPSAFVMFLRKYLRKSRLNDIQQHGMDRVVIFELSTKEGDYSIVAELFRDGNMVLVKDGIIVHPLFTQHWKAREIKAKEPFVFPPSRNDPRKLELEQFTTDLIASDKDLVRTLVSTVNIPGRAAEEVCKRADIEKGSNTADLSPEDITLLFTLSKEIVIQAVTNHKGMVYTDSPSHKDLDEALEDETLDEVTAVNYKNIPVFEAPSYLEAMDRFFSLEGKEEEVSDDPLENELKRLERRYQMQKDTVKKKEEEAQKVRELGELIYANYQKLDTLIDTIFRTKESMGWDEVIEQAKNIPAIKDINVPDSLITIEITDEDGKDHKLDINIKKDVNGNASTYYEKAKTMMEKSAGARTALEQTEKEIERLKKEGLKRQKSQSVAPTKHFWFESYKWCISSDGHLIMGGKDAISNEKLVKKHLKEGDRYAHADYHGAPSCVVKSSLSLDGSNRVEIPESTLSEACHFAAIMSRAWHAKIGSASAYWVLPSQVSKTAQAGEFVPKGAFIIRGKRNLIDHIPIEGAIGEVMIDGNRKVMFGPLSTVSSRSSKYVVIVPGQFQKTKFANMVAKYLNVPQEEVLSVLPPGDVTVIRAEGIEWEFKSEQE